MSTLTLNRWLKEKFGCKVYKLSLSTGCTCPNRDGKISTGGCTFCSEGGSGEFGQTSGNIDEQIRKAVEKISSKLPKTKPVKFIAYFQSFSNTYETPGNPFENIADIFHKAISHPEICALSIGTRPDCISGRMIDFLSELNKEKHVWIELGLQTIHEKTAEKINRCHKYNEFLETYYRLQKCKINTCIHIINGLPGEDIPMMMQTAEEVSRIKPHSLKIHMLHIIKNTTLASEYKNNPFYIMEKEEYIKLVCDQIEIMHPEIIIERVTGDGRKSELIAPLWTCDKKSVINGIDNEFRRRNSFQGKKYKSSL